MKYLCLIIFNNEKGLSVFNSIRSKNPFYALSFVKLRQNREILILFLLVQWHNILHADIKSCCTQWFTSLHLSQASHLSCTNMLLKTTKVVLIRVACTTRRQSQFSIKFELKCAFHESLWWPNSNVYYFLTRLYHYCNSICIKFEEEGSNR